MKQRYVFRVNGRDLEAEAGAHESLLDVLRERLRLTGSKKGCNEAECGSCTVL
ncbi:MAG: 2Fe-2S iron-sulfur cluster-binding protein, partial [Deltaproteobacteria bacterium]|nr:2Fe-2S iron-sulfur cluster-binding protein [Deltaproteobacteria bacterium]